MNQKSQLQIEVAQLQKDLQNLRNNNEKEVENLNADLKVLEDQLKLCENRSENLSTQVTQLQSSNLDFASLQKENERLN